jgi:hypothetical protein
MLDPISEKRALLTRKQFFGRTATGIGSLALGSLLGRASVGASSGMSGLSELPHFAAKAKRVIYLFMNGAPTHVDLFDYKPEIQRLHGTPVPESFLAKTF